MFRFLAKLFSKKTTVPEPVELIGLKSRTITVRSKPADYADIMSYEDWLDGDFVHYDGTGYFIDDDGWEVDGDIFAGNPKGYANVSWYNR